MTSVASGATTPNTHDEPPFLKGLNEGQRRAVEHDRGAVAVLAGPGTGKTRVIVHRVARLVAPIHEGGAGAEPESVLALAFTIKSAEELRERLAKMECIGPARAERVRAMTVHSFGRSLVRRFGDRLGLPSEVTIMDSAQRLRLLRDLAREHNLFQDRAAQGMGGALAEAVQFIEACRNEGKFCGDCARWIAAREKRLRADGAGEGRFETLDGEALLAEGARLPLDKDFVTLFELYERACLERGLITLDDYITLPIRLLRERADVRAIVHAEIRHIVVDEFQDWNPAQIEMLKLLAPPVRASGAPSDVCVVGDDDQAIYAFRGADDRAFQRFADHWKDHEVAALDVNYRSGAPIVAVANEVIARANERFAPDKTIVAAPPYENDEREPASVEGVELESDGECGAVIAAMIRADREANPGRKWSEYAVLARTTGYMDQIAGQLETDGVPVDTKRRSTALDDPFVQDLFAWMRLLTDPHAKADARRLLVRVPVLAPVPDVQAMEREYAAMASRAEQAGENAPPYLEWLLETHGGHERVRVFAEMMAAQRAHAVTGPADAAVERLVREVLAPVVHTLDARERAESIRNLVEALRFARDKVSRLPPPADLAAFLSYYEDLSPREQAFERVGDERVENAAEDEDSRADAVRLLTAHSAKGLEFDTVFVVRVRPGAGFPMSGREDGEWATLPEELSGREETNHSDEERRLFYVACTRAKRRLVLLAKQKKSKSAGANGDYFLELTHDPPKLGEPLEIPVVPASRWLDPSSTPDELEAAHAAARWIDREARIVRASAAAALSEASRAGLSAETLAGVSQRLSDAARRLATLAHLREHGVTPAFVENDARDEALREYVRIVERSAPPPAITRPQPGPLRLSYTSITDYRACPRCYFVKHVLRLDESKTEALSMGDIAHKSLEAFYKEWSAADADADDLFGRPGLDRLLQIGAGVFDRTWPRHIPVDGALRDKTLAQLRNAYERLHNESDHILEVEASVQLPWVCDANACMTSSDSNHRHTLIAKIDRIDQLPGGGFRIIDYKTGQASKRLLEPKKDDLQLGVYAIALAHHLGGGFDFTSTELPVEGVAEYWALSTGERGSIALSELRIEKTVAIVNECVSGILSGRFDRNTKKNEFGPSCRGLCAILGD